MSTRLLASLSVASAILAVLVLMWPFVGVFTCAVLGPLAIGLGARAVARTKDGGPTRKLALLGLTMGLAAVVILAVFIASGAYSDIAR